MPNEAKRVYGTQWTLSSGSDTAIASAAVGTPAGANNPYTSTQTGDYPNLALVLTTAFASTPNQNSTIDVHIVPQQVDGTTDARDISASYRPYWRGSFTVDNQSTSQTYYCEAFDVPKEGKVMLFNAAGQQLSANYTLKATPFTLGPA
jgi:hypothetical protein